MIIYDYTDSIAFSGYTGYSLGVTPSAGRKYGSSAFDITRKLPQTFQGLLYRDWYRYE